MCATLRWNRNQVYFSVTPTLAMLRWREHHIVNQALVLCIAAWFGKLIMVVVKHTSSMYMLHQNFGLFLVALLELFVYH